MIYAKAHNRRLWINAKSAGQLQRLTDYFLVHASSSKTISLTESLNQSLLNESYSSIFPLAELRDLDSLFPVYDQVLNKHIDPHSKLVTTFDFNIDYPHDILLHEQCGSGPSWNVFERLVLTSKARISISERLRELPPRYNAVHIRNTDLKTNYKEQLKSISAKLYKHGLPVLICTDNYHTLQACKSLLVGIDVLSIYKFPNNSKQAMPSSLHYNLNNAGWDGDIGLLSDLMALALSENLFILQLENGSFSGFSTLAQDLHSRPWILERLFGSRIAEIRL